MRHLGLCFALLCLCSAPAGAATVGSPDMKCAAYLEAEAASGWSEGVTGQPAADRNQQQTDALHAFCAGHPDATVADAQKSLDRR